MSLGERISDPWEMHSINANLYIIRVEQLKKLV
jgi:hypothetical protein